MPTPFSLIFNNPLAICDDGLKQALDVYRRNRADFDPAALAEAKAHRARQCAMVIGARPLVEGRGAYVIDGVAVIPVVGPLFRHASIFEEISAITSYETIARMVDAADADDGVREKLLRMDSPGGEAMGCRGAAQRIFESGARKPITTHIEGLGASGGWWIASPTGHIVADPVSFVGSIGVRIVVTDDADAQKNRGEREIEIVSSNAPGKRGTPIDPEVLARYQARADEIERAFVEDVARYRGVSVEDVIAKYGSGDVLIATKARAVGMIDGLASFDSTLADIRARNSNQPTRVFMSTQDQTTQIAAPAPVVSAPVVRVEDAPPPADPAPAAEPDEMPMRCAGCDKEMGDEPVYCAACAGMAEEASVAKASLSALVASIGAKTFNEAVGMVANLRDEATAAKSLRASLETDRAAARMAKFGASLSAAVGAARVTLADLTGTIPAFLDAKNRTAANAAIAALSDGAGANGPKVAAAIVGAVALSEDEAERVGAYLAGKQPIVLPAPAIEPERDSAAESAAILNDDVTAFAAKARETFDRNKTTARA